jgi:hypothetical protein
METESFVKLVADGLDPVIAALVVDSEAWPWIVGGIAAQNCATIPEALACMMAIRRVGAVPFAVMLGRKRRSARNEWGQWVGDQKPGSAGERHAREVAAWYGPRQPLRGEG